MDLEMIESRYADLDDQTVGFETSKQDLDAAPYSRDGAATSVHARPCRVEDVQHGV
jgi:hypothetical protein